MRTLNIYSKARNGKAKLIHTVQIEDSFDAAVVAFSAFSLTMPKSTAKVFWNWADSAWDRRR